MNISTAKAVNGVAIRLAARNARKRARQEAQALMILDGIKFLQQDAQGTNTAVTTVKPTLAAFVIEDTARKTQQKLTEAAEREAAKLAKQQEKDAARFVEALQNFQQFAPPTVVQATATQG